MPTETVHVLGAGGHARVVIDALLRCGRETQSIALRDDRADLAGILMLGCRIDVPALPEQPLQGWIHAAIGQCQVRQRLLERSGIAASRWLVVRHPAAVVAASARLGEGSFIGALAVIGPCASIGRSVIVNHGAVVDHDCIVGQFSHIAPRATLGGGVRIGTGVLVGSGATVLPGITVGDQAVIGAGAVVLTDVAPGQTVAGIPAREINKGKT
jgi:sugar O-acyltransferase (sialic acid O-acetyltransferase NeuD family)